MWQQEEYISRKPLPLKHKSQTSRNFKENVTQDFGCNTDL